MVGIGIMAQIAWQVFCNIAVVTNTLPNTGISLPFFSSGGTSLILLLAEMGVMVNIGRNGERAAQQREQMRAQREAARAEREAELARKTIDLASARAARTEQVNKPQPARPQAGVYKEESPCVFSSQPAALPDISILHWPLPVL